jgi:hypothetical protein
MRANRTITTKTARRIIGLGCSCGLLALSPIAAVTAPPPAPAGYVWQAIPQLTDEFNGTSLDAGKWLNYHPYWTGRDSTFDPTIVSVGGGCLALRSTATSLTNIRAACVSSKTKAATSGCYCEASVRASKLSMMSSFWFQGSYSEIDVIENIGASVNSPGNNLYMFMNTHYFPNGWNSDQSTSCRWRMPTGCEAEFHTYGVWWKDARNLTLYHNDLAVTNITTRGDFVENQYLFFDTEVFSWEGIPTLASLQDATKNTMDVDWLRSWKLVPVTTKPTNLTASVTGGQLVVSWPADHIGWTLQVQTNPLTVGIGTNWISLTNSLTTNLLVDPMDQAKIGRAHV